MILNAEQKNIVKLQPNGHMLINGVAGSGKTTVSVKRAEYLLKNYCRKADDKVLILTYTNTLISYINHIVDRERIGLNPRTLKVTNVSKLAYEYAKCNDAFKDYKIASINQSRKILDRSINDLKKINHDRSILENKNFLLDEIKWIDSCNIESLEEYQTIDRKGRGSLDQGPQLLGKNSLKRETIYNLKIAYKKNMERAGYTTFEDQALMALDLARSKKGEYTHIIVDEAQDLTKVQLMFIKELSNEKDYSSLIISSDTSQSIYPNAWIGKGNTFSSIGLNMAGRSKKLTKNYRTTTEISKSAFALIENDEILKSDENYIKPGLMDRAGEYPIYKEFNNKEDQLDFICKEIEALKEEFNLSDICIISRTKTGMQDNIKTLNDRGIRASKIDIKDPNFDEESVKFTTLHSIKGLEFKVVFIIDLNHKLIPNSYLRNGIDEDVHDSNERRLLYVGMTRARNLLYLSSSGEKSKFIEELDMNNMTFKRSSLMKPFYSLKESEYIFQNNLSFLGEEEKVRQWVIRELTKTYAYPLSNMEIEYAIKSFSKNGFVDLTIFKNSMPYIFVECKASSVGIEEALNQLKSYMEFAPSVEYGLAINGVDMIVIDRSGRELDDLPAFKKDNILGRIKEIKDQQSFSHCNKLPLLGDVAAGAFRFGEQDIREYVDYYSNSKLDESGYYCLKVAGDSMEDADICRGDIVVVKYQNTAENNDIVIARMGEESTMKRFRKTGNTIFLIPENPNYDVITMDENDVEISGLVIDTIKQ